MDILSVSYCVLLGIHGIVLSISGLATIRATLNWAKGRK